MSTAFYTEMADLAAELLTEFGQVITLRRDGSQTIQAVSTDNATAGSSVDYSPNGLFLDLDDSVIDRMTATTADANLIQKGDKLVYLDNTVVPQLGDKIIADGQEWAIVQIKRVKPTTIDILFKVVVRG